MTNAAEPTEAHPAGVSDDLLAPRRRSATLRGSTEP